MAEDRTGTGRGLSISNDKSQRFGKEDMTPQGEVTSHADDVFSSLMASFHHDTIQKIKAIVERFQLAPNSLKDKISDALLILLASRIEDTLQPTLANCLQSSTPMHDMSSVNSLQMLWFWRQKESTNATCLTLIQVLLKGGFPTAIAELIISYVKSEHVVEVRHRLHSSKYSELGSGRQERNRIADEEIRLRFARTYIRVMEKIGKSNCQKIFEFLAIDGDNEYIFSYVLERCSWINYSLLEELAKKFGTTEIVQVMGKYVECVRNYLKKDVFEIPPESFSMSKAFFSKCTSYHFCIPEHKFFSGLELLKIQSKIAEKLNIPLHHFIINGVGQGSLVIEFIIDNKILESYLPDSPVHTLVIQDADVLFINLEPDEVYNEGTDRLSDPVSGTSDAAALLLEINGKSDYSYPMPHDATDSGGDEVHVVVSGTSIDSERYDYKSSTDLSAFVEEIVIQLEVQLTIDPKLKIDMEEFRRIILKQKVPVALCLVASMGLPYSGKTTILKNVFKMNIKFKKNASKSTIVDCMTRKENKNSFTTYELCVLGGPPFNQYSWSFATKRYGVIFSILCGLVRHASLASTALKDMEFILPLGKGSGLVSEHFDWLMKKAMKHLEIIVKEHKKQTLLLNGLSLINVMNISVNKAVLDFLPIMFAFCRKNVRLSFFSLERDEPNFDKTPYIPDDVRKEDAIVFMQRSRLTHLLHFATIGYKPDDEKEELSSSTRMVATTASNVNASAQLRESQLKKAKQKAMSQAKVYKVDQFLDEMVHIDSNDKDSLEASTKKVQDLIRHTQQYQDNLPLRWIFLRSLVVALNKKGKSKTMILHRDSIIEVAKELEMDKKEVDEFLTMFTDFGSILYMPQFTSLRNIVIVDIWEFTEHLNKLFYNPIIDPLYTKKYGIITQHSAKEILHDNEQDFMQIMITFAMAARVMNKAGNKVLVNDKPFPVAECYYLPLARAGEEYTFLDEHNQCVLLKMDSVNFPMNVQAGIAHQVMKNDDAYLVATEYCNTSRFEFRVKGCNVRIAIIHDGSTARLQIMNKIDDAPTTEATVVACSKVLLACCNYFRKKANLIRNVKYSIAIPCCASEDADHQIYCDNQPSLDLCAACLEEKLRNPPRHCWIEAAKCYNLNKKKRDDHELTFDDISQVAKDIARVSAGSFNESDLAAALALNIKYLSELKKQGYEKEYLAMEMLMKWKCHQTPEKKATKSCMARIMSDLGYDETAKRLDPLAS